MYCWIRTRWPHKSTGTVKAKADGECEYEGPFQSLESELHYLLQKWIQWGWWGYYYTYDVHAPNLRFGTHPYWSPYNNIWVLAPYCITGTWRSRANLYVAGSLSGDFSPYPFVTVSWPVYIEC